MFTKRKEVKRMHCRIEIQHIPPPWYIPKSLFRLWLGDKLKTSLQEFLHTVRLQSPYKGLEYEWCEKNQIFFFVDTPDQLTKEEEGLRIDLCADVGNRLQSVGFKFFKWVNPVKKFVCQLDFVLPNGQRFIYPQDAEKGEIFPY